MSRSSPALSFIKRLIRVNRSYQAVFDTREGGLVLRDLLVKGGVLETSFTPGDPEATAFKEGRRSLALEIIEALRWSEGELVKLAQERTSDRLALETEGE